MNINENQNLRSIFSKSQLYLPNKNSIASLVSPCSGITSSSNIFRDELKSSKFVSPRSSVSSVSPTMSVFSSQSILTLSRSSPLLRHFCFLSMIPFRVTHNSVGTAPGWTRTKERNLFSWASAVPSTRSKPSTPTVS